MENVLPPGYAFKSSLNNNVDQSLNPLPPGYAFKSSLAQPIQQQQQPSYDGNTEDTQPGFAKALLSTAATAPFKMAESVVPQQLDLQHLLPEGQRQRLAGAQGLFPEQRPKISQAIEQSLGTEGYKPSGLFEQALHDTAGNWPLLALTGGVGAARVGADVASSIGMRAAEDFGPIAQIGAGVLAHKGFII